MTNNTCFDRFHYSFDDAKYGSGINLNDDTQRMLSQYANSSPMADWQKRDLANGPLTQATYFKNPIASNCASLISSLTTFKITANSVSFTASGAANVGHYLSNTTPAHAIAEVGGMKDHTDRISGAVSVTPSQTVPTLDGINSFGTQNIMILKQTDGISNAVGGIGAMTSLFLGPDIDSYTANVNSYIIEINNNTTYGGFPPYSNTCSLSAARLEQMNSAITSIQTNLYNRRNGDYVFYQTSIQVAHDFAILNKFSKMSNTMTYLVENLIGTDELKAKLAAQKANT
jgi:hypothetical protein